MCLLVSFSYPLQAHPARKCILTLTAKLFDNDSNSTSTSTDGGGVSANVSEMELENASPITTTTTTTATATSTSNVADSSRYLISTVSSIDVVL